MRLLRKPSHSLAMSAFGVSCVRGERDIVTIVANTIPASTISKFPCTLLPSQSHRAQTIRARRPRTRLAAPSDSVVTTSRYSRTTVEYYQRVFQRFGSRGSALTVIPFNQASKQDVETLVNYIYTTLGLDLALRRRS